METELSSSSTASAQAIVESSTPASVPQIQALKSGESAARPASPATRRTGSTRGKKPAVVKPTFTGRRSKQERDALEKAANEREKERAAARQKEEAAKKKEQERGHKRDREVREEEVGIAEWSVGPFLWGA